jgi:hypothetical protein
MVFCQPHRRCLCTIIRPDPQRAWLELWQVGGEVLPILPVPAEFAEFLRHKGHTTPIQSGTTTLGDGTVSRWTKSPSQCTHHLGPLCTHGLQGDDYFLQRMGHSGVTYGQWSPPVGWAPRPGERPPPARWEPVAAQYFRWWMGGLTDASGAILPEIATWMGWMDCDRSSHGFATERQDTPQVPRVSLTPSLLHNSEMRNLFPIMDRGTTARVNQRATVVPIKVESRKWRPGQQRQNILDGKIFLQPRRTIWLEQRHRAGLGIETTPTGWFREMGKAVRSEVDFLTPTPEFEYMLVDVLHLGQQVCASAFSAMRSASTTYFRNPVDGPMGHPIRGMYPSDGTTCFLPTTRELDSLLQSADANWDISTVSVAVLVQTETMEQAQNNVQSANNAQWMGYGNYGQWVRNQPCTLQSSVIYRDKRF